MALAPVSTSAAALANETLVTALAYRSGTTQALLVATFTKYVYVVLFVHLPVAGAGGCGPFNLTVREPVTS